EVLVRGMGGVDHLVVDGLGTATGTYTGGDGQNGEVTVGNTIVHFKEFEPDLTLGDPRLGIVLSIPGSTVTARDFLDFTFVTPRSSDEVSLLGDRVKATSGGKQLISLVVQGVSRLTVDTAANELAGSPDAADTVSVSAGAGSVLQ